MLRLCPLEPNDQISRLAQWVIQVVDWPLERSVFLQWRSSEGCEVGANKAVLFCTRNPEVTKTYLRYVAGFFERSKYR